MSARHFANVPCATCKRDTLHYAMVCRECGTVALTNFEAVRRSVRRHMTRRNKGVLPRAQYAALRAAGEARKAERAAAVWTEPMGGGPFGAGRERTRA